MNKITKLAALLLSATVLVTSAYSQDQKPKSKEEKSQEIIIRKKGGKTEKMTIIVDGDDVTINGKPVDEFKTADVTVLKRNAPFMANAPGMRNFRAPRININSDDFSFAMPASANKAMLGVMTEKADNGVRVKDVTKESGAEKAGIKKDDIITKVGNTIINNPGELVEAISKYKPKETADITYIRDGKENKTAATLGENKSKEFNFDFDNDNFNFNMPQPPLPPLENFNFHFNSKPKLGLEIQDVEDGKGVMVNDVDENSAASKAGLKEGDVITQINGKEIAGVDELRDEIKEAEEGATVKLTYKRDGKTQTAELKIPKRIKTADL